MHTLTVLEDGRVLAVGGVHGHPADRPFTAAQPADFRAKFTDMKRGDAPDGGAVLTDLPRIDDE